MSKITKATLFKPKNANSKQATTDSISQQIINAEAAARQAKTARLRKQRLAKASDDEQNEAAAPPAKPAKRRAKASTKPKTA